MKDINTGNAQVCAFAQEMDTVSSGLPGDINDGYRISLGSKNSPVELRISEEKLTEALEA